MDKEEFIKNFDGTFVGIIVTKSNGDQTALSFPGRQILGYYNKAEDRTTDFYFRPISRGNTLISLLYQGKK